MEWGPLAAGLAALLAVGGFMFPVRAPKLPPIALPPPAAQPTNVATPLGAGSVDPTTAPPPPPDWSAWADSLTKLRDKPPEMAAAPAQAEPVETEVVPEPIVPELSGLPPLGWRYTGMIIAPGGVSALIATGSGYRFVFKGQTLADEADPSGPRITVKQITSEEVLLERRGAELRLAYEPPASASDFLMRISNREPGSPSAPQQVRVK